MVLSFLERNYYLSFKNDTGGMKMTKRLILFDFDETYYKHHTHQADMPYLREMEGLLQNITTKTMSLRLF